MDFSDVPTQDLVDEIGKRSDAFICVWRPVANREELTQHDYDGNVSECIGMARALEIGLTQSVVESMRDRKDTDSDDDTTDDEE